jgi:hypothetical protein
VTNKKTKDKVGLNEQIAEHARMAKDWRHQADADKAYALFEQINALLFDGLLPQPVIGFDAKGRLKKAGDYSYEGDSISLKHHFDLRQDLSELELVMALIHNSVHLQTETYEDKKTWYHSADFRDKMEVFGLLCSHNGDVSEIILSKFESTLKMIGSGELIDELHNYEVSEAEIVDSSPAAEESEVVITAGPAKTPGTVKAPKTNGNKGTSKMKKWSCACTNIRAATTVTANCTECGQDFMQEGGGATPQPIKQPCLKVVWGCSCTAFTAEQGNKIDGGCYKCGLDFTAPALSEGSESA